MCIALPAKIVERLPGSDLAKAEVAGTMRDINVGLLSDEDVAPGDWVLIHSGFAMSKMSADEARASLDFLGTFASGQIDQS